MGTLSSEIELNRFDRKKPSIFSWIFPLNLTVNAAALPEGHTGKSTELSDAHFAHHFQLSLESRGAGGSEGLARPLERFV